MLIVGGVGCNKRLQEMMTLMARDRGGSVCAMDHRRDTQYDDDSLYPPFFHFVFLFNSNILNWSLFVRYCIDNGAMIAQAGVFAYQMGYSTPIAETSCTQR